MVVQSICLSEGPNRSFTWKPLRVRRFEPRVLVLVFYQKNKSPFLDFRSCANFYHRLRIFRASKSSLLISTLLGFKNSNGTIPGWHLLPCFRWWKFGSYRSRIGQKMDRMIVMETNEANESCWLSFPISVTFEMQ